MADTDKQAEAPGNARRVTARLVRRGEEEKEFDREFWRNAGPEARLEAAWQMVVETHLIRGGALEDLRLNKSVERVIRRRKI